MSALEWFPTYADKFLQSRRVRAMSLEEVGAYQLLLCEQWRDGPIPDDDQIISGLCKHNPSVARAVLERCFVLTDDGWSNPELQAIQGEQEKKHQQKVEAGRKGGKAVLKQNPPRSKNKETTIGEKRKKSFPKNWMPNDLHKGRAIEYGVDLGDEAEKFENHAIANGRKVIDWNRAFTNWLINAKKYAEPKSEGGIDRYVSW